MSIDSIIKLLMTIGLPLVTFFIGRYSKFNSKLNALTGGLQMLLRLQLEHEYDYWHEEKHYAPQRVQELFLACYMCYHSLGKNGVMTERKDEFLQLPISSPKGKQ